MDLGWVGMTSVWSEKVRTSRWTSRWTSSMTTGGTIGVASQLTSQNPKTVKSHLSLTLMQVKLVNPTF